MLSTTPNWRLWGGNCTVILTKVIQRAFADEVVDVKATQLILENYLDLIVYHNLTTR